MFTSCCTSCLPTHSNFNLVPFYVFDNKQELGKVQVTLWESTDHFMIAHLWQQQKIKQTISSLILKGFHFSSLYHCRWRCISSELAVSNLPCWPRIGSQGRESIANLFDEAALKCFTSSTFSFFSKLGEKCIISKSIHTIKEICSFALERVISWHKARNVTDDDTK